MPMLIGSSMCVQIPDSVAKTDYYLDGIPRSEISSRQQREGKQALTQSTRLPTFLYLRQHAVYHCL